MKVTVHYLREYEPVSTKEEVSLDSYLEELAEKGYSEQDITLLRMRARSLGVGDKFTFEEAPGLLATVERVE